MGCVGVPPTTLKPANSSLTKVKIHWGGTAFIFSFCFSDFPGDPKF